MIIFWTFAAGLLGLASLFVALPLLQRPSTQEALGQDELNLQVFHQRLAELEGDLASGFLDQDQYAAARRDLERELLYDLDGDLEGRATASLTRTDDQRSRYPLLALALVALVGAGSVLTYLRLGERDIIPRLERLASNPLPHPAGTQGQGAAPLEVLAEGLAARMEKNPDNLDGWIMLGRTYFAIKQPQKALDAMERAYKLAPEQPSVILAYAEAVAANSGNRLEGRPAELIRAVLSKEPGNPSARWLDGMLAFQQRRFADATGIWEGLLNEMDPSSEESNQMRRMIAEAQSRAGLPKGGSGAGQIPQPRPTDGTAATTGPAPAQTSAGGADAPTVDVTASPALEADPGASIQVSVSLDPGISAQAMPEDAVFVYARAAAGPPMPLAVQRYRVSDLPVTVTLDDSMAMMPAMRLSAFPRIIVGARISKSGQATPQSGDLEGQTDPIMAAEAPTVSVTIDQVRP